jgi:hypothetical protein
MLVELLKIDLSVGRGGSRRAWNSIERRKCAGAGAQEPVNCDAGSTPTASYALATEN